MEIDRGLPAHRCRNPSQAESSSPESGRAFSVVAPKVIHDLWTQPSTLTRRDVFACNYHRLQWLGTIVRLSKIEFKCLMLAQTEWDGPAGG